ncbi:TPA: hypothetical protein U2B95_000576 [Streptococcus suis]|nr:hypothetical protein [Streptococcus suis]
MIPRFRVWDTVKKAMSEVEAIVYTEERVYPFYSKVVRRYIPFSEAVLMQSTGLFDKNGKEIFEDDVVKSTWFNDYDDCVGYRKEGTVVYRNGYFGIEYPGDVEKGYSPTILDFAVSVEIIGNIHQNPELVEG